MQESAKYKRRNPPSPHTLFPLPIQWKNAAPNELKLAVQSATTMGPLHHMRLKAAASSPVAVVAVAAVDFLLVAAVAVELLLVAVAAMDFLLVDVRQGVSMHA